MVLPYIDMNQSWVYICSPSWTPLLPSSSSHPSGSSQCTSPEHPVSCIEPGLAICFTYDNIHVSMLYNSKPSYTLNVSEGFELPSWFFTIYSEISIWWDVSLQLFDIGLKISIGASILALCYKCELHYNMSFVTGKVEKLLNSQSKTSVSDLESVTNSFY